MFNGIAKRVVLKKDFADFGDSHYGWRRGVKNKGKYDLWQLIRGFIFVPNKKKQL